MSKQRQKYSMTNKDIKNLFRQLNIASEENSQQNHISNPISSPLNIWRKDLHGMILYEVKTWLFCDMVDCVREGYSEFMLIHGYHGGTVIRDYLRGSFKHEFFTKFSKFSVYIVSVEKGVTLVIIK